MSVALYVDVPKAEHRFFLFLFVCLFHNQRQDLLITNKYAEVHLYTKTLEFSYTRQVCRNQRLSDKYAKIDLYKRNMLTFSDA